MPLMAWMTAPCRPKKIEPSYMRWMRRSISNGSWPSDALGQAAANLVRQRRLDDRLGHQRRRIDLADADDAGVGVDLDDERFLAAVAALVDVGQAQVDRLDAGDFHGSTVDQRIGEVR